MSTQALLRTQINQSWLLIVSLNCVMPQLLPFDMLLSVAIHCQFGDQCFNFLSITVGQMSGECVLSVFCVTCLTVVRCVTEKTLRSTVTLTAARGRGKSAALGISIASAVAFGYSNIFVTSPSPENLNTLFDFVFSGLDALQYKRHMDYEAIESTNPEFNRAIVRVNIFRDHRQTIQFILPQDHAKLAQVQC